MNQLEPDACVTAIGLMSGTSMDGIDVAILVSDGENAVRPGASMSRAYEPELRGELRLLLDRMADASDPISLRRDCAGLETRLTRLNADIVLELLDSASIMPADIGVIGYHGQTVLHRPQAGLTIQLGDGQALAEQTGITVVNDFRAADVAAGGEGAPFAPAYHRALAQGSGAGPQVIVNIGGVANVTWLDPRSDPIAFDTGPGNALIDDFVTARTGKPYDDNGALARAGSVEQSALERLLEHAYFHRAPPKSLDRNTFSLEPVDGLSAEDGAATLTAFTAQSIALGVQHFPEKPERFVVAGGGRKNAAIMKALNAALAAPVLAAEEAGWRGDDVEAEAFAYLAVRALKGLALSWPTTTGVPEPMTGGVVHLP